MTPEQTASRLDARKTASGWQAKCPAHEDKHASLSIAAGDNGNVLLKCHAGCEFLDIVRAANFEPSDLFPETDMADAKAQPRRIVAEYNYRNAEGDLSYQVVRYEPKDFRQRKPENGGWDWSIKGCLPVLYRLPELLAAPQSEPVFVVEGEKDADALAKLGLIATTNAGGAAKWNPAYNRQLAGRLVVILPDNDEPGRKHADIIAGQVKGAQVIHLPGLPPKGDVSDWLAAGGTSTALKALISTSGFAPSSQRMRSANDQRLKNIKRILPYNVSYLDDELLGIHPNDIVIIMAATGAGKCLAPDTPVLMFSGDIRRADEVRAGDVLMGPGSSPRTVLGTGSGTGELFRITPVKGDSFVCNDVHVLTLCHTVTGEIVDVPLNEYMAWHKTAKHCFKLFRVGADFPLPSGDPPVDPWLLGFWYADGTKELNSDGGVRTVQISKPWNEATQRLHDFAKSKGCTVTVTDPDRCPRWSIVTPRGERNPVLDAFREIDTSAAIPSRYLTGSREERSAFLAGWIDGDGYSCKGATEIISKRIDWAEGIAFIARSLGLRACISRKPVQLPEWSESRDYWRVSIVGDTTHLPIATPSKRCARNGNRDPLRTGFSVESCGVGRYSGFELDGDGRFLLGDFTVTHNTTLGSILAQKAAEDGKRIRFFALEAYQNEIEVRTLYRELSRISEEAGVFKPWMTQQKWIKRGIKELEPFVEKAISNLEKRLGSLETYYRATKFDREDIHREFMACKGQVDLIILDHLHYVDSDGPNENVELKKVVQVIRDCGQALGVPVIVIAHIRKKTGGRNDVAWIPTTDDLHGSSDVTKIATTIVAVAPARDEDFVSQEPGIANTFMSVLKDRIGGDKGYAALMRYDLGAMQYRHHYRLCTRLGSGKVAYVKKNPGWANNALPPGGAQESTQMSMGDDDDF